MARDRQKSGWRRHWPRLLFLIPFIAVLWVPFYNRMEPELGGIPFFYWYQLAWILLAAAIVLVVYAIEAKRRATKSSGKDTTGIPGDIL
jgi:uncharacterized membrane protein YhaH (DUF805 family)